jgi:FixJ family two-component response regulator
MVRPATARLVRSLGFEIRTFATADSFLRPRHCCRKTRSLVLDVQTPNKSGVELPNHLSQLGFAIPIMFITAYPDKAPKDRVLEAGAVSYTSLLTSTALLCRLPLRQLSKDTRDRCYSCVAIPSRSLRSVPDQ